MTGCVSVTIRAREETFLSNTAHGKSAAFDVQSGRRFSCPSGAHAPPPWGGGGGSGELCAPCAPAIPARDETAGEERRLILRRAAISPAMRSAPWAAAAARKNLEAAGRRRAERGGAAPPITIAAAKGQDCKSCPDVDSVLTWQPRCVRINATESPVYRLSRRRMRGAVGQALPTSAAAKLYKMPYFVYFSERTEARRELYKILILYPPKWGAR